MTTIKLAAGKYRQECENSFLTRITGKCENEVRAFSDYMITDVSTSCTLTSNAWDVPSATEDFCSKKSIPSS